jgi:hypothetical protein
VDERCERKDGVGDAPAVGRYARHCLLSLVKRGAAALLWPNSKLSDDGGALRTRLANSLALVATGSYVRRHGWSKLAESLLNKLVFGSGSGALSEASSSASRCSCRASRNIGAKASGALSSG